MNNESEQQISAVSASNAPAERGLRRAWVLVQSTFHWLLSAAYFFPMCAFLVLLGIFIDPRKNDGAQRMLCRVTMKLAGAKLVVRRAPGFDPKRTCFFLINHVNLFDPFVLYAAIPQFFRGLEFESHFRIPMYGWLMNLFGNVPVPVSMVGAFEFNKKTSWLLRPGKITVYLHDVIETKGLRKEDFPALRDRVQAIISSPIDEAPDVQKAGGISG